MKTSLCVMLATVPVLGCLLMASCSDGQDGDPGPKGAQGLDGPDGAAGNPGKDGAGFQESIAHGNIVVSFTGKLDDGRDFADTINFKHAPLGVNGFIIGSLATISDDVYNFSIRRFYGAVDPFPDLQDNFVHLDLDVIPTEDGNIVIPNECTIHTYMHASATKLIVVQHDFAGILSVDDFEDCQYNAATGDLSFRLTLNGSHQQADVGLSELEITMVATLKVFQYIEQVP